MIPALQVILFPLAPALPKPEELDRLLPTFAEVLGPAKRWVREDHKPPNPGK